MEDENVYEPYENPDSFGFDHEVNNMRFALMMNYRYGYEKRYIMQMRRLKAELKERFPDSDGSYIDKLIERIVLTAERTIDRTFFQCIGKPIISMR